MFEELFHRNKQTKVREFPKELDAVQRVSSKKSTSRTKRSSISVDSYLWIKNTVLFVILAIGIGIVSVFGYGLVADFITHSSGEITISNEIDSVTTQ